MLLERLIPMMGAEHETQLYDLGQLGASQNELKAYDEFFRSHQELTKQGLEAAKACKTGKDYNGTASVGNNALRTAGTVLSAVAALAIGLAAVGSSLLPLIGPLLHEHGIYGLS